MTRNQKPVLYVIYILLAAGAFACGVLLMFALYSIRANGESSGRSAAPASIATAPAAFPEAEQPVEDGPDTPQPAPEQEPARRAYSFPLVNHFSAPPFLARNVIVFIGDGMGLEHVKAGGIYANGAPGTLPFENFPFQARMITNSLDGLTDSAAAGTAMATGHKVNNTVVSISTPDGGRSYLTLLEYAASHGMSTGLVTTTPITNATPACFAAHAESRYDTINIAQDYLNDSRPNILFGGGTGDLTSEQAGAAGYSVVTTRDEMLALDTEAEIRVSGQFGDGYLPYEVDGLGELPHLSEMTRVALRILDNDPDGFFIMIEGGRIDTAAHKNNASQMVGEVAELGRAVQAALDWANEREDTLIIVLADHETGGLTVTENRGQGETPGAAWKTDGHTSLEVGVWMTAGAISGRGDVIDNTQIPGLLTAGAFPDQ